MVGDAYKEEDCYKIWEALNPFERKLLVFKLWQRKHLWAIRLAHLAAILFLMLVSGLSIHQRYSHALLSVLVALLAGSYLVIFYPWGTASQKER